jgi:hypothetical protein
MRARRIFSYNDLGISDTEVRLARKPIANCAQFSLMFLARAFSDPHAVLAPRPRSWPPPPSSRELPPLDWITSVAVTAALRAPE